MAARSQRLVSGPITSRDWFSLRLHRERERESVCRVREGGGDLLRAFSISMVTRTERAMVIG